MIQPKANLFRQGLPIPNMALTYINDLAAQIYLGNDFLEILKHLVAETQLKHRCIWKNSGSCSS